MYYCPFHEVLNFPFIPEVSLSFPSDRQTGARKVSKSTGITPPIFRIELQKKKQGKFLDAGVSAVRGIFTPFSAHQSSM
jgi:hypothetical protein